jgi:hypothetical protein
MDLPLSLREFRIAASFLARGGEKRWEIGQEFRLRSPAG